MKNTLFALLILFSSSAFAEPPSFLPMTTNIDLSTAMYAVLDIFVALASFAILWTGSRKILEALGWGVDYSDEPDPNDPDDIRNYEEVYDESGKRIN